MVGGVWCGGVVWRRVCDYVEVCGVEVCGMRCDVEVWCGGVCVEVCVIMWRCVVWRCV